MSNSEINNKIIISKVSSGENIVLEQSNVQIREGQNKLMALSYKAPLFDTNDLERFFENLNPTDRFELDIGGTGSFGVRFRGIVEGKEKNFSQNIDHKILLLEEYKCYSKEEMKFIRRSSRFVPRGSMSK